MKFGSLFAGIGGIDLGLERAGMQCAWQVEINDLCRRVLSAHWPNVPKHKDIKDVGQQNLEPVDLVCGGFPCQPVSQAGNRQAQDDPRWLWPEFYRVVCELRPEWVLLENVTGILKRGLTDVLGDFAEIGYDAEWQTISASAFGAPHLRQRVFIVAYPHQERWNNQAQIFNRAIDQAAFQSNSRWGTVHYKRGISSVLRPFPDADFLRVDNGFPSELDKARVAMCGNAVVPVIIEWIGQRILEVSLL
jgi:DNA (cytosine-5)-methyltransferase 1